MDEFDKIPERGAGITTEQVRDDLLKIAHCKAAELDIPVGKVSYHDVEIDEHVLNGCSYFHPKTGKPSCLVGQWLSTRFGVTKADLEALTVYALNTTEINDEAWSGAVIKVMPNLDEEVTEFIGDVQARQDEGDPWLIAINRSWESVQEYRLGPEDDEHDDDLEF